MTSSRKQPSQKFLEKTVLRVIARLGLPGPGEKQPGDDAKSFPVVTVSRDPYQWEFCGYWLKIESGGASAEMTFHSKESTRMNVGSLISFGCDQRLFDRADRRLLYAIAGAVFLDPEVVALRAPTSATEWTCQTEEEIPALTEEVLQEAIIERETAPWLRQWAMLNMDTVAGRNAPRETAERARRKP